MDVIADEPISGADAVEQLRAAGVLDEVLAKIDTGQLQLTGQGGFLPEMVKAVLERGLSAELTEHLGYEKGDPIGRELPNARNGYTPKTVASEVGDVRLAIPRDREGSFTPTLVPKGSRRIGGLDDMIVSLYAGGMTIRDIEHHLASTIGTELSHETISKITDAVLEEVIWWQKRPLEELYPILYMDALTIKVRDGHHVKNRSAHIAVGLTSTGSATCSASGSKLTKARNSGKRLRRAGQSGRQRHPDRLRRRADRIRRGDRSDLAARHGANLRGASDP
ncbi:IS256 family transposase [Mycolicibacterium agri]|uniref:IS256 family transposase n=1 Tax=Mycolicibacterium agri TaxID=36811 RepID=UPI0023530CBD|nr:transposase [Mycolicibacterium agri]